MITSHAFIFLVTLCCIYGSSVKGADPAIEEEELKARSFLKYLNKNSAIRNNRRFLAEWDYTSNITKENLDKKLRIAEEVNREIKNDWKETIKFNWKSYRDPDLRRQFKAYVQLGEDALPEEKYKKLQKIISDMEKVYSTAKICEFANPKKCDLSLEPELNENLSTSHNPDELKHIWVQWRKAVGKNLKHQYQDYVKFLNEAAHLNNHTDATAMWLYDYDTEDIKEQIQKLWEQIKPLYLQMHAYVRFKLREKYGEAVVSKSGPIPAHLLGNMWAQSWESTSNFTAPYPEREQADVTEELQKQGYTATKIFKTAEDFFVSLNLTAMPEKFWKNSILEKPNDRKLVCHASAWDFYDGEDFRIKQCTRIEQDSFITAHHEMGHIEYFLQYRNQPSVYRGGANSGFHEAVGDVISLSVSSLKHLHKVGLAKEAKPHPEDVLNNLFHIGLSKIVFLPFAYVVDLWRWNVFSGNTKPSHYNCNWWKLRNEYQGIEPPIDRSEEDFDPVSKYHVVANVPYIRYFISFVIQFQFHRSLCEKAGQYVPGDPSKPLHECDIYGSTEAGNALGSMLQLGASKPWQDAMEVLTGQRHMDASGLLEYFEPLTKWLTAENKKNGAHIGWDQPTKVCKETKKEDKH